jgi:two-component system NarL family sensor kinase
LQAFSVDGVDAGRPVPGIWRAVRTEQARADDPRGVRRVVSRFALSGLAALILLGAAGVYVLRHTGRSEAIRNATEVAQVAGRGVVEPALTPALMRGDPAAVARVDRAVRRGVLHGDVVRVKVWTPSGRIVYSDEHRLIGQRYSLGEDDLRTIATGKAAADLSDLSRPENRFERRFDKLLEVYVRIKSPTGGPLMFETYERYSSIAASGRRVWLAFVPAILGSLALLWLVQLPIAWGAARRLREGQAQRERLLQSAIESSELERRRIARDLHDGAVQDLAGVSFNLTAAASSVGKASPEETNEVMTEAASDTRRAIRQLRSLLVDIYPPDLHRTGLEAALRDLVAPLAPHGIDANLRVPERLELTPATEMLFYRSAQEALRNVVKHADATHVELSVQQDDGMTRLIVHDDGRGFDPGLVGDGHMGLQLLADLAREAGGKLGVDSSPAAGTRVCIEVPQ